MTGTVQRQELEELFRQTGKAHHQAFIETDGEDPEWPLWYAEYLQPKLAKLANASFTTSELVYLIMKAENERATKEPDADWPDYYTRFFIEQSQAT